MPAMRSSFVRLASHSGWGNCISNVSITLLMSDSTSAHTHTHTKGIIKSTHCHQIEFLSWSYLLIASRLCVCFGSSFPGDISSQIAASTLSFADPSPPPVLQRELVSFTHSKEIFLTFSLCWCSFPFCSLLHSFQLFSSIDSITYFIFFFSSLTLF